MSLCFFSYTRCQKWFQAKLGRALTLTAMSMTDLSSASQVSGGANRHLHAWRAALTMDERGGLRHGPAGEYHAEEIGVLLALGSARSVALVDRSFIIAKGGYVRFGRE